MVTSKQKLTEQLPDILDELREVQLFFTVWRAFTNVANKSIFQPTMEQYPQFFDSIVRASFSAVIVGLYRIYDGDHRTKSLRQLYMHTKSLNILEQKLIERTSHLDSEIQSTWKKVCILRSNIFGHRNAKLSPEKAFDKAKLTPDELAAMIKNEQELFNWISKTLTHSSHAFNLSVTKDVSNLMRNLRRNTR